ncbi:MAG: DUF2304 domain-containing protein [Patescibacteria group bacterium]|jgi:hypothetical protein
MIIATKIIAIFLAVMVISKTFYDYKRKRESLTMFLFWTLAWIFIAYVALVPGIFYSFATKMADQNVGTGTFVGLAFIFLFFITYRIYMKAHRLEQQIRDIVMRIGIKDIEEKK